MTTQTDVIQQVAEAKCPKCDGAGSWPPPTRMLCQVCNGKRLRWFGLSRECSEIHLKEPGTYNPAREKPTSTHKAAGCSGRVADVTLEKIFLVDGFYGVWKIHWPSALNDTRWLGKTRQFQEYGDTPLEAACAALLATIE